ncbi:MAG: hypothetical protein LBL86_06890 [Coriobacteriales bacterium]|jgi:hypothetical protein|nr:hypothetical protein [Coriobacteriales bacterium]
MSLIESLTEAQVAINRKDALVGFATAEIVSYIMEDEGLDVEEAFARFYQTKLSTKLEDYDTGYYLESSAYLYEIYQEEQRPGQ